MCRREAVRKLDRNIKGVQHFTDNVARKIRIHYPDSYVTTPEKDEVHCIIDGHYYLFVIIRPHVGCVTKKQKALLERVKRSGGTAAAVTYPNEAVDEVCRHRLYNFW